MGILSKREESSAKEFEELVGIGLVDGTVLNLLINSDLKDMLSVELPDSLEMWLS